jgi:hypothetical protein
MANFMIVRQRVIDLARFQTAFDRLKPDREAAGLIDLGQFCAADESDVVIVVMNVKDISRAKEYWHSDVSGHSWTCRCEIRSGLAYRRVGEGSSDKAKASAQAGRFRSRHLFVLWMLFGNGPRSRHARHASRPRGKSRTASFDWSEDRKRTPSRNDEADD